MIVIIATAIACFIVGGVLSYILFRYALKSKYDNVLKEAETEAEVIKKNKLLEVKEKFLNKKADLEKEYSKSLPACVMHKDKKVSDWDWPLQKNLFYCSKEISE